MTERLTLLLPLFITNIRSEKGTLLQMLQMEKEKENIINSFLLIYLKV